MPNTTTARHSAAVRRMRCPAAKPIPSASSPDSRKRTDSTRNGGQYSTTIRDEVKAELQIVANASPSPSARQSNAPGEVAGHLSPRRCRRS